MYHEEISRGHKIVILVITMPLSYLMRGLETILDRSTLHGGHKCVKKTVIVLQITILPLLNPGLGVQFKIVLSLGKVGCQQIRSFYLVRIFFRKALGHQQIDLSYVCFSMGFLDIELCDINSFPIHYCY